MKLRTTNQTKAPAVPHAVHKVEGVHQSRTFAHIRGLRRVNLVEPTLAFLRRIPKRLLVATIFVAVYRAMCGYQMSFIGPGVFTWFSQGSTNGWVLAFPEFNALAGWFAPPDTQTAPHVAFAAILFADTLAAAILLYWLIVRFPALLRRKSPWRGRTFKH